MNGPARIRSITDGDWDGIVALEAGAYSSIGLSEERSVLQSRVRVSPGTCFALDVGGRLAGYVMALPYPRFRYPDPARAETSVLASDNLHLHDLVIADGLRGRGLAKRLLHHLMATAAAHRYAHTSLVAVGGSAPFWSGRGFTAHPDVPVSVGYGKGATYMSRAAPHHVITEGTDAHGPHA
jgi:ribosomal protein S18 acetylase RimI-like enzyme